jgi:Recombinase
MANSKTPMQRQREERRALGWRDANIWLTPEAQQQVARLSEPGESLSTLIGRALNALDILQRRKGTRVETRDVSSEAVEQDDLQSIIAREVSRYFSSETFREQLFIPLLRQTISSYLPREVTPERTRELTGEISRDVTRAPASADKASLLKRLRTMQAEGLGPQAMADQLNAEGVPTLRGEGRWHRGTISNLLKGK